MQTFAPYPDAERSAAVLDKQRVFKQTVETYQILLWLHGAQMWLWAEGTDEERRILVPRDPTGPRYNHPAIRLWAGNERALGEYQRVFCAETDRRGINSTVWSKSAQVLKELDLGPETADLPAWWGDTRVPDDDDPDSPAGFHFRHRSNLVLKNPQFYGPLFPDALPLRHEVASVDDLYDGANYYGYEWPEGRRPFKERKAENYRHTLELLGTHAQVLARKQEEFSWGDDHPAVLAFRERFAEQFGAEASEEPVHDDGE